MGKAGLQMDSAQQVIIARLKGLHEQFRRVFWRGDVSKSAGEESSLSLPVTSCDGLKVQEEEAPRVELSVESTHPFHPRLPARGQVFRTDLVKAAGRGLAALVPFCGGPGISQPCAPKTHCSY